MYYSYKRQWIFHYDRLRHRAPTICKLLRKECLTASLVGIHKFLQKYRETRSIERQAGLGRSTKMTLEVKEVVERKMREDDEATTVQLCALLVCSVYTMTLKMVLRCCSALGWTFRENKTKHLDWAQEHRNDNFADVIWTDECLVQMESHRWFCCRKCGAAPKAKPRWRTQRFLHHFIY